MMQRSTQRGFSLVEVLISLGILGFLMSGVLGSSGGSAMQAVEVLNVTTATQIIEGVVLDLEEEYRTEGFPTNQLEGRKCELPRDFRDFECEYDLLALEIGSDNLSNLGSSANDNVTNSPLMQSFCGGGADGMSPVDPAQGLANLMSLGPQLPQAMQAFNALLDPGFNEICGLRLDRMCTNTMMIASFIPDIIRQAAVSTRKLVVRLRWGEEGDADRELRIETFITSVVQTQEGELPL